MGYKEVMENTAAQAKVSRLPPWLAVMRPEHWIKNLLLFMAIPFALRTGDAESWLRCALGFAAFCLICSAIYIFNDILDRASDAAHPVKCLRPIASGALSVPAAAGEMVLLLAASVVISLPLAWPFWLTELAYVALMLLYSLVLKQHAIIDVIAIALGFVLRAMASAAALWVPSSAYLVLCTFMLCLFIALSKRRGEVQDLSVAAGDAGTGVAPELTRRVNPFYTPQRTEHMLSVSAGLSIITYSLYCVSPQTAEHLGSRHLVWTVPLVVYAMFRFYCITARAGQADPVKVVLRDKVLWLAGLLWLLSVGLIIHFGKMEALRSLLV